MEEVRNTKPSIDWSQVSEKYRYLARDGIGEVYLYVDRPERNNRNWWTDDFLGFAVADVFKSLDVGDCHWTESLIERPEGI